jgi:dipeptide/tripeptide permease
MGLSMVSKLSPVRYTALMMGGWNLATTAGGLGGGKGGDNGTGAAGIAATGGGGAVRTNHRCGGE